MDWKGVKTFCGGKAVRRVVLRWAMHTKTTPISLTVIGEESGSQKSHSKWPVLSGYAMDHACQGHRSNPELGGSRKAVQEQRQIENYHS
ncbi:hypothetical protein H5410_031596 [Solanum commersonii]|uniref:Uncharacterized protein n=1 Tax=Solanum commersonii TaxID=4109 RepID=A0A9J5YIR4_SOLCO|nr:hypothetical protein H5410_031596 [Solanum commersonii]